MSAEKVAVTLDDGATPVAPFAGVTDVTDSGCGVVKLAV